MGPIQALVETLIFPLDSNSLSERSSFWLEFHKKSSGWQLILEQKLKKRDWASSCSLENHLRSMSFSIALSSWKLQGHCLVDALYWFLDRGARFGTCLSSQFSNESSPSRSSPCIFNEFIVSAADNSTVSRMTCSSPLQFFTLFKWLKMGRISLRVLTIPAVIFLSIILATQTLTVGIGSSISELKIARGCSIDKRIFLAGTYSALTLIVDKLSFKKI